ncbi:TPA: TIGR02221 family CRISPR-associated protein [Candidatus Bipolaricaulota bacterium]|nr:TIGR02221 family CRISPR-associated protein [Candidatus Bipolaricaulota bacterium]
MAGNLPIAEKRKVIFDWLDNGHKDRGGNVILCEGLGTRLALINISARVKEVRIPSGKNEQEIWDIFSTIVNEIEEKDELYLDITHAFRSLPLLATVIINYLKVMKNIQVRAISYGAMEAVGDIWTVKQIDIEQRDIPVFNLLPFDQLLDFPSLTGGGIKGSRSK